MEWPEFSAQFPEPSKIGEDKTDTESETYFDNGKDVGVWRVNRRTTVGHGEVLDALDALIARGHFGKYRSRLNPAEFMRARRNTLRLGVEVMEHLHKALLAVPEFTLADGRKAHVEPFTAPELDKDGEPTCGVDVWLDDGTQIEMKMTVGDLGMPMPKKTGRGR